MHIMRQIIEKTYGYNLLNQITVLVLRSLLNDTVQFLAARCDVGKLFMWCWMH
jgi:hypothetical protein